MTTHRRLMMRILSTTADRNLRFEEIRSLLLALGFAERIRGSRHIFTREDIEEILNLQPGRGGLAKPYQVRQIREVIWAYGLAREV